METPLEVKLTESYYKTKELKPKLRTIVGFLKHFAGFIPDNEAVVFVSTDDSRVAITWSQLYQRSEEYARALSALGLKRGEVVALCLRHCPEWIYATLGAITLGAMSANVVFNLKDGSDVIAMTEKLGKCAMLIMDPGIEGANWQIAKKLIDDVDKNTGSVKCAKIPYLRYLIGVEPGDEVTMLEVMHLPGVLRLTTEDVVFPELNETYIAFLFNTSGSTGNPKIVAHTHASIIAVCNSEIREIPEHYYTMYNDRPFPWIGGCILNIFTGMKRITLSGFCEPPQDYMEFVSKIVAREQVNVLALLPSQFPEFFRRYEELKFDETTLIIASGGQPVRKDMLEQVCKPPKCIPVVSYGGTEFGVSNVIAVMNSTTYEDFKCGQPSPGVGVELKVVNDNGEIVPVNTRGELYVRSPGIMKGYFNDPERTAKVMTSDGWYKTDDIARLSEDGVLFVEARKSNVIISDGINVIPEILERTLQTCPGVENAVIVPVPDERYYQVLCACVVCSPGSDVDEDKLRTFCEELFNEKVGLMASKLPKFYMILESFPDVYTGKVNRLLLTKMATERFA